MKKKKIRKEILRTRLNQGIHLESSYVFLVAFILCMYIFLIQISGFIYNILHLLVHIYVSSSSIIQYQIIYHYQHDI